MLTTQRLERALRVAPGDGERLFELSRVRPRLRLRLRETRSQLCLRPQEALRLLRVRPRETRSLLRVRLREPLRVLAPERLEGPLRVAPGDAQRLFQLGRVRTRLRLGPREALRVLAPERLESALRVALGDRERLSELRRVRPNLRLRLGKLGREPRDLGDESGVRVVRGLNLRGGRPRPERRDLPRRLLTRVAQPLRRGPLLVEVRRELHQLRHLPRFASLHLGERVAQALLLAAPRLVASAGYREALFEVPVRDLDDRHLRERVLEPIGLRALAFLEARELQLRLRELLLQRRDLTPQRHDVGGVEPGGDRSAREAAGRSGSARAGAFGRRGLGATRPGVGAPLRSARHRHRLPTPRMHDHRLGLGQRGRVRLGACIEPDAPSRAA